MSQLHQAMAHIRAGHWDAAHKIAQDDPSELAAWLHGILHIQEGDLPNARYWYGQARQAFADRGTLEEELQRFEAVLSQQEKSA